MNKKQTVPLLLTCVLLVSFMTFMTPVSATTPDETSNDGVLHHYGGRADIINLHDPDRITIDLSYLYGAESAVNTDKNTADITNTDNMNDTIDMNDTNGESRAIGNSNYKANVLSFVPGNVGTGSYAKIDPTTVGMSGHGDYWIAVTAVNEASKYYAEVAFEVTWRSASPNWHTKMYFIYSDPTLWPGGQIISGTVYDLGYSADPPSHEIAVYSNDWNPQTKQWNFVVDTITKTTYTYGVSWYAQYAGVALETYDQPPTGTNGQTIVSFYQASYRNSVGVWTATNSLSQTRETSTGFKVSRSDSGSYHYIKSTA